VFAALSGLAGVCSGLSPSIALSRSEHWPRRTISACGRGRRRGRRIATGARHPLQAVGIALALAGGRPRRALRARGRSPPARARVALGSRCSPRWLRGFRPGDDRASGADGSLAFSSIASRAFSLLLSAAVTLRPPRCSARVDVPALGRHRYSDIAATVDLPIATTKGLVSSGPCSRGSTHHDRHARLCRAWGEATPIARSAASPRCSRRSSGGWLGPTLLTRPGSQDLVVARLSASRSTRRPRPHLSSSQSRACPRSRV